jgi:hypothetical protein
MGSVSDCNENARCESFFATLECELLARKRFRSQAVARIAVFDSIAWGSESKPQCSPIHEGGTAPERVLHGLENAARPSASTSFRSTTDSSWNDRFSPTSFGQFLRRSLLIHKTIRTYQWNDLQPDTHLYSLQI